MKTNKKYIYIILAFSIIITLLYLYFKIIVNYLPKTLPVILSLPELLIFIILCLIIVYHLYHMLQPMKIIYLKSQHTLFEEAIKSFNKLLSYLFYN